MRIGGNRALGRPQEQQQQPGLSLEQYIRDNRIDNTVFCPEWDSMGSCSTQHYGCRFRHVEERRGRFPAAAVRPSLLTQQFARRQLDPSTPEFRPEMPPAAQQPPVQPAQPADEEDSDDDFDPPEYRRAYQDKYLREN